MAKRLAHQIALDAATKAGKPQDGAPAERLTENSDGTKECLKVSSTVKTVEDLLRHIGADMSVYEVEKSEGTKWEVATKDHSTGEVTVTPLYRVWVRLKPRVGTNTLAAVQAMIDAARLPSLSLKPSSPAQRKISGTQVLVVADCHFGKYGWSGTTGADYDLDIAQRSVSAAAAKLLDEGDARRPARRCIAFLGDLFHYDNPQGTTTGMTQMERDGRLQKMLQVGCDTLLGIVSRSVLTCPTDVVVVNGNHDETLTWTFHRLLIEKFRGVKGVTICPEYTSRQYKTYGKNLLGFAHGNRAKRKLPQLMALEVSGAWGITSYREYHTGHFHSQHAEWQRPIETIDGVIVRTAPALCPADDYHVVNGYVGSPLAMESFFYRDSGGLDCILLAGAEAPNGKAKA